MDNLTLVIPAKYEKESLPSVLRELEKYNTKITIVLEESDKETISSIKEFNCDVLFQKGKGYGDALIQGINSVETEYFCIFNADGSFDENDLPKMLELNYQYDFVFTSRYSLGGSSEDDTIITYLGNQFFSLLGRIFFSLKISDILYTFVMGNVESFKKLNVKNSDFRFCVEFPIKMQKKKMKYFSIPSFEKKRIAGIKKVNAFKDGFLILLEMIRLFFK